MPLPKSTWIKSSYSSSDGCVEVKDENGFVLVRDSKNPHVGPLKIPKADWEVFIDGVRAGEFDPF
jgi:hypothetical protein